MAWRSSVIHCRGVNRFRGFDEYATWGLASLRACVSSLSACSIKLLTLSPCSGKSAVPMRGWRVNVRPSMTKGSVNRVNKRLMTKSRSCGFCTDCRSIPKFPVLNSATVSESRSPPLRRIKIELFFIAMEGFPRSLEFKDSLNPKSKTAT